jgi:hypothetical protein
MTNPDIGSILRENIKSIGRISYHHWKIVNAIMNCRTNRMGGHVYSCPSCGHFKYVYHSCRNRHCPKCGALAKVRWLEKRVNGLLPIDYYHIVFTIPQELNQLIWLNKAELFNLFFHSVKETLLQAAKNPDNLGCEIGFLTILHTWGSNLMAHPHIHCLVSGGGLSIGKNKWKNCKKGFFISVKKLSRLFRGKYLHCLKKLYLAQKLEYGKAEIGFQELLDKLYQKEWVVYAKKPFAGPKQVLDYLGRYTHRIAITNNRLISFDNDRVIFRWKDYKDNNKIKQMSLDTKEFIRRFLLHILPARFVRIRSYGFLSNKSGKKLASCLKLLSVEKQKLPPLLPWHDMLFKLTGKDVMICEQCHQNRYEITDLIRKTRLDTS